MEAGPLSTSTRSMLEVLGEPKRVVRPGRPSTCMLCRFSPAPFEVKPRRLKSVAPVATRVMPTT